MNDPALFLLGVAVFLMLLVVAGLIADSMESPEARDARRRNDP